MISFNNKLFFYTHFMVPLVVRSSNLELRLVYTRPLNSIDDSSFFFVGNSIPEENLKVCFHDIIFLWIFFLIN